MEVLIEVTVEHTRGKFASKEEVYDELAALLDCGSLSVGEADYEVSDVSQAEDPGDELKRLRRVLRDVTKERDRYRAGLAKIAAGGPVAGSYAEFASEALGIPA